MRSESVWEPWRPRGARQFFVPYPGLRFAPSWAELSRPAGRDGSIVADAASRAWAFQAVRDEYQVAARGANAGE